MRYLCVDCEGEDRGAAGPGSAECEWLDARAGGGTGPAAGGCAGGEEVSQAGCPAPTAGVLTGSFGGRLRGQQIRG